MTKKRYLHKVIKDDLREKMVFIGGPRQVGKTTLARYIGDKEYDKTGYLNWDNREDRKMIIQGMKPADAGLVIYDELHKYRNWKNHIKGEFDKHKNRFDYMVTGSARLDLYRRGGDSMLGRYHYYRLHPFSLAEVLGKENEVKVFNELRFAAGDRKTKSAFDALFAFGGFPEPFLKQDQKTLRRFHNEYTDRLIMGDIRDMEQLRDLSALQFLVEILPEKVGSLLSLNSLREDLQVTHKTVGLWMDVLERFYYHFRIRPYRASTIKSLRKEPKMYLWDWSQIEDDAGRLENMVASHLLKLVHYLFDAEGHKAELFFIRDTEGRETDFLVAVNRKPWFAVEVKISDSKPSRALSYFTDKLKVPFSYQVVRTGGVDLLKGDIRVISADKFLSGLI